jgi:hypothetical protein
VAAAEWRNETILQGPHLVGARFGHSRTTPNRSTRCAQFPRRRCRGLQLRPNLGKMVIGATSAPLILTAR